MNIVKVKIDADGGYYEYKLNNYKPNESGKGNCISYNMSVEFLERLIEHLQETIENKSPRKYKPSTDRN